GPGIFGAADSNEVMEVGILARHLLKLLAIVNIFGVAGSIDQPQVATGEARGMLKQPLHESAHGSDAGAGGDEQRIAQRIAQHKQAVRSVEFKLLSFVQVAKQIRKKTVLDAIQA